MKHSLLDKYGILETEAETDLLAFLDQLVDTGMIQWGK
jgi:hypothetical protein